MYGLCTKEAGQISSHFEELHGCMVAVLEEHHLGTAEDGKVPVHLRMRGPLYPYYDVFDETRKMLEAAGHGSLASGVRLLQASYADGLVG